MSYTTWHNYGYGIRTDAIETTPERIEQMLALAPKYAAKIHASFADCEIAVPTVDDYIETAGEFDCGYCGMASLMKGVIEEAECIKLIACDDCGCRNFLIYPPRYPWRITEKDMTLTEEGLRQIFAKYVNILTEQVLDVDYQEVEKGG